jgi:predicted CoA-binding protein
MISKTAIDTFWGKKALAVVGISQSGKKFGDTVYKELKAKDYKLFPIHRSLKTYDGRICFPTLSMLPEKVGGVFICVSPEKTADIVKDAWQSGIENIWIQQKSESEEAIVYCQEHGLNTIYHECILMYADPVGFPHSLHKFIWKIVGKLPK